MERKRAGIVEWLEFKQLTSLPFLVHGVFLRHGGVSPKPFHSLNVGIATEDAPEHIQENLERIQKILGFSHYVIGKQCHETTLEYIYPHYPFQQVPVCDGFFTQEKGVGLIIQHADCQAALIVDPKHRAVAAVHAGWRGNVQNIYAKAIQVMRATVGSRPEELVVCISPSLGPDTAEFLHYQRELPASFWRYQVKPFHFDLWEISKDQLLAAGVLYQHIEIAAICTYSCPEDFYSYRREKMTGRHATVIALR